MPFAMRVYAKARHLPASRLATEIALRARDADAARDEAQARWDRAGWAARARSYGVFDDECRLVAYWEAPV